MPPEYVLPQNGLPSQSTVVNIPDKDDPGMFMMQPHEFHEDSKFGDYFENKLKSKQNASSPSQGAFSDHSRLGCASRVPMDFNNPYDIKRKKGIGSGHGGAISSVLKSSSKW